MANVYNSNTFYVDTSSDSGTAASYVDKRVGIVGLSFFMNATTDTIKIYDKSASSAAAGSLKLSIMSATAKDSVYWDMSGAPMMCPNGVWVTITGSPQLTLTLVQA
jgi:hypothetical protein